MNLQNTLLIVRVKYVVTSASKKHLKPFRFTFQCVEGVSPVILFICYNIFNNSEPTVQNTWNQGLFQNDLEIHIHTDAQGVSQENASQLWICYITLNTCERVSHTYKMQVWNSSLLNNFIYGESNSFQSKLQQKTSFSGLTDNFVAWTYRDQHVCQPLWHTLLSHLLHVNITCPCSFFLSQRF